MSDVQVPFGDRPGDQATLLLAAAEELGLDQSVVKTYEGGFLVPEEVKEKAFPSKKPKRTDSKSESKDS